MPVHGIPAMKMSNDIVVADLHLGIERGFASRGFRLPSGTESIIESLNEMKGERLYVLGDFKDQLASTSRGLENELIHVIDRLEEVYSEILLVKGNHDAGLPEFPRLPPARATTP